MMMGCTSKLLNSWGFVILIGLAACQQRPNELKSSVDSSSCESNLPKRFGAKPDTSNSTANTKQVDHLNMVFIPAGEFMMGAADEDGREDEYPQHTVKVNGFWMDKTEVTNASFAKFVAATGYITTAERKPDWEEMKKQLPAGTPKPHDSVLVAASLVFFVPKKITTLHDASQWWNWKKGANWRHPQGPNSNINGKEHYPAVHISWDDAMAYCRWSGKRLPTEAEWEFASRGKLVDKIYPWGNEDVETGKPKANTWQGSFPTYNTKWDGFNGLAATKQYPPNAYGLYDMAGNVWEWCADWYRTDYYQHSIKTNPQGPTDSDDPMEPGIPKRVVRGGSFMCIASYCKGYRVSARMKTSPDTGLEHTGFRCVSSQ